ncbi:MAG: hypothetical protein ACFFF4_09800 [Candidatus Thorarchaeota archaeon]
MSSGDIEKLFDSCERLEVKVIGTCPCFSILDGKPVCLIGESIVDVDVLVVHPDIIVASNEILSHQAHEKLPLCHKAIQVSGSDDSVICLSRQMPVKIRKNILTKRILMAALELFPSDMFSSIEDVCTECLYKLIISSLEV